MILPQHPGETCVIIGNGESLKTVPRTFLDRYPTFGCNYINRLPYQPTYYVCIDSTVLTTNPGEIYETVKAAKMAFISNQDYVKSNPGVDRLRGLSNVVQVGLQTFVFAGERYMSGNTAVYVALKVAYFMGFDRALLVGVDHSDSFAHFTPDYPGGQGRNMAGMRYHFALANDVYQYGGREIINLSPPSLLDKIFQRDELTEYDTIKA